MSAIGELLTLGLLETFFNMRSQGLPLFVSPVFLGILGFKRVAEYIFRIGVAATSKAC
jgi:hypothetical protein